jgi:hypothetical protein
VSLRSKCSQAGTDAWPDDAAKELKDVCENLDAAAREARSEGIEEDDNELVILAEEVIDLATRALVVTLRVTASAEQQEGKEIPDHSRAQRLDLPTLMGRAQPDSSTSGWPVSTVKRLQASVTPMGKTIRILSAAHTKESVDDLTVLREEVMDVAARLLAANARVRAGSADGAEGKSAGSGETSGR